MTELSITKSQGRFAGATIAIAMLVAGAAANAQAIDVTGRMPQPGQEMRSRVLHIDATDQATPEGQRRLDTRLQIAAGEVCGKWSTWGVRVPADYVRCYDTALSTARAQAVNRLAMGGPVRVTAF